MSLWVKIMNLSLWCWKIGVSRVVDFLTTNKSKLTFAQVCI